MKVKRNIVQTYIYSVVSYGLECVSWTKSLESKINIFQNKIMRILMKVTILDKITIETLKAKTGLKSLFDIITQNNSISKKIYVNQDSIAKTCTEGIVPVKRT